MPKSSAADFTPAERGSDGPGAASPGAPQTRNIPPTSTIVALVIALIAVALAIVGWFRPPTGPGKFNDQQRQDAKTSICSAANTVNQAVGTNTNMSNPTPGNPAGALAVASNARLALYAGGGYLHERLDAEPATPKDLNKAVTAMADTLQSLSINYLAGASPSDSVQQPLRDDLKSQLSEVGDLCK
jgi:hypothetical protein